MSPPLVRALLAAVLLTVAPPCTAQTLLSLHVDSVFYGDNTEFAGPFRSGETILGAFQWIYFEISPNDRATVQLGLYANERAGSRSPVDRALPIVALRLGTTQQRFVFGTLDYRDSRNGVGPDRRTPHGLLPPLALETLWFTRAYEAGLAKLFQPAAGVDLEASFRVHRIEANWAYSYRLLATVYLKLWQTTVPWK
jgi:hypothetical protein